MVFGPINRNYYFETTTYSSSYPTTGALYLSSDAPFHPILLGGGQESGRRAGTENTPMIIGLGEAARIVNEKIDEFNKDMTEVTLFMYSLVPNKQTRVS